MKPAEILEEALNLQKTKGEDYQNNVSTVRQADYYPRGIETIYEVMNMKMLRLRSLIDWLKANPNADVNHESMKDSCVDLINYASFLAAYLDKDIDGQDKNTDAFNIPFVTIATSSDSVESAVRPFDPEIDVQEILKAAMEEKWPGTWPLPGDHPAPYKM